MTRRRIIFALNQARHATMQRLDSECKARLDVSAVQLTALFALCENNGCLMKELAETLMLDNSAVTGLIKRMKARQLIEQKRCEHDGRAQRVYITQEGRDKAMRGRLLLDEANDLIKMDFSDDELDTVVRYLDQLTHTMRQ